MLLEVLCGVTETLAARVPTPERWSILQCVEHVALGERYLLSLIKSSKFNGKPLIHDQREILIAARGADRSVRTESPPDVLPKGSFSSLREALEGFLISRRKTLEFVNTNQKDLRSWITWHPLAGTVSCREVLALMAVHPVRHAKQIEENKAVLAI